MLVVFQKIKKDFIGDVFVIQNLIRNHAKKDVLMILIAKDMLSIVPCQLAHATSLQPLNVHQIAEGHTTRAISKH